MRHYFVVLLTISLLSSYAYGQEERLVVHKDPTDPSRFICDVKYATFTTPKGWQPNRSGGNTYAILLRSNETYPKVTQMISIDIFKPVEPTAKELAVAFAKRWNGRLGESSVKIDGEKGYRVTIPSDNKTMHPVDCIVAIKDARAFMLIGGAKENGDLGKALDDLVASWKWKK